MKKIVLFGAYGQLGSIVVDACPESMELHRFGRHDVDITNHGEVKRILEAISPDTIINCCAYTAVDQAEKDCNSAFNINAYAVENLAHCADAHTSILHISTDFVFSNNKNSPYLPDDKCAPVSVYGKSKLAGEVALVKSGMKNFTILRTSWLYSSHGSNFVTTMLKLMQSHNELKIVNDQFGSPTSAHTLAEVIWKFVINGNSHGIYHWSDKGVISWYDFALEIYRAGQEVGLINKAVKIEPTTTSGYPTPAQRPVYSALDSSKTEDLLDVQTSPWKDQLHLVLNEIKNTTEVEKIQ